PSCCASGPTPPPPPTAAAPSATLFRSTSTVTVRDTTPPTLTVPAPLVLECNGAGGVAKSDPAITAWLASAAASDICDGATITDDAPALFPSGRCAGSPTTRTFTAADNC